MERGTMELSKQLKRWVKELRKKGVSDEDIEKQLLARMIAENPGLFADVKDKDALIADWIKSAAEPKFRWQVNSSNPCPTCTRRNGMVKTFEVWEAMGTPKEFATECDGECTCTLEPA
jgi:hypothetical protein